MKAMFSDQSKSFAAGPVDDSPHDGCIIQTLGQDRQIACCCCGVPCALPFLVAGLNGVTHKVPISNNLQLTGARVALPDAGLSFGGCRNPKQSFERFSGTPVSSCMHFRSFPTPLPSLPSFYGNPETFEEYFVVYSGRISDLGMHSVPCLEKPDLELNGGFFRLLTP